MSLKDLRNLIKKKIKEFYKANNLPLPKHYISTCKNRK